MRINIAILLVFLAQILQAQTTISSDDSQLIFDGYVIKKESVWLSDESKFVTINWFKPNHIFKGETREDLIPVLTVGGVNENEALFVPHAKSFHSYKSYIVYGKKCNGCVDNTLSYLPLKEVSQTQSEYKSLQKELKFSTRTISAVESLNRAACDPTPEDTLFAKFGHIYLTIDSATVDGYFDIHLRTNTNQKPLYDFQASIEYDTAVFGANAVANDALDVLPRDSQLLSSYTTTTIDAFQDVVSVDMEKEQDASTLIAVGTEYSPAIRISFSTDIGGLFSIPENIGDLFDITSIAAQYECRGAGEVFDTIIFEDSHIGINFAHENVEIEYDYKSVVYDSLQGTYKVDIYAKSTDSTILDVGYMRVNFSTAAFNGSPILNMGVDTALSPALKFYDFKWQDVLTSSFWLEVAAQNVGDPSDLLWLDTTPTYLLSLIFDVKDCTEDPNMSFNEFNMLGKSLYFNELTFPTPMVYDDVVAFDEEKIPACGCSGNPTITSWITENGNDEIVGGGGQVLTIYGSNFGVFERDFDPGMNGEGSSVLFYNGDFVRYFENGMWHTNGRDSMTAVSKTDFLQNDILYWSDDEIRLKVPATSFESGIGNSPSSGEFMVRNRCNKTAWSNTKIFIPYSHAAARVYPDGVHKVLGLRDTSDLGEAGYVFARHTNTDSLHYTVNIENAFLDALQKWCFETDVRFRVDSTFADINATIGSQDSLNLIMVEPEDSLTQAFVPFLENGFAVF